MIALITLVFNMVGCSTVPATATTPSQSLSTSKPTSVTTTSNSPDVTVSISPVDPTVKSGDNFTMDILIDSKVILRGAQCALVFDPALMKCDRVVEGTFFKNWADANGSSTVVIPQPTIDNVTGNVSDIGIAIMGTKGGGAKGNGVFCTYHFTALADGVAKPTLSNVLLSDESGKVFPATVSSK